jgi:triacylglycerol lipase
MKKVMRAIIFLSVLVVIPIFCMVMYLTIADSRASNSEDHRRDGEIVVLLHGVGHSKFNMLPISINLKKQGYQTHNITYPSTKQDIPALSKWLNANLEENTIWSRYEKVHFVTHSMGGVVTGRYLEEYKDKLPKQKIGRVVMLGVPNGGSEVADLLKNFWGYKLLFGPAGQQLTTKHRAKNGIKPWYDLGVIAGTSNSLYPIGDAIITDENDGRVSVPSTKVTNMKDHIELGVQHGFMAWDGAVNAQIVAFLQTGQFKEECLNTNPKEDCL